MVLWENGNVVENTAPSAAEQEARRRFGLNPAEPHRFVTFQYADGSHMEGRRIVPTNPREVEIHFNPQTGQPDYIKDNGQYLRIHSQWAEWLNPRVSGSRGSEADVGSSVGAYHPGRPFTRLARAVGIDVNDSLPDVRSWGSGSVRLTGGDIRVFRTIADGAHTARSIEEANVRNAENSRREEEARQRSEQESARLEARRTRLTSEQNANEQNIARVDQMVTGLNTRVDSAVYLASAANGHISRLPASERPAPGQNPADNSQHDSRVLERELRDYQERMGRTLYSDQMTRETLQLIETRNAHIAEQLAAIDALKTNSIAETPRGTEALSRIQARASAIQALRRDLADTQVAVEASLHQPGTPLRGPAFIADFARREGTGGSTGQPAVTTARPAPTPPVAAASTLATLQPVVNPHTTPATPPLAVAPTLITPQPAGPVPTAAAQPSAASIPRAASPTSPERSAQAQGAPAFADGNDALEWLHQNYDHMTGRRKSDRPVPAGQELAEARKFRDAVTMVNQMPDTTDAARRENNRFLQDCDRQIARLSRQSESTAPHAAPATPEITVLAGRVGPQIATLGAGLLGGGVGLQVNNIVGSVVAGTGTVPVAAPPQTSRTPR